MMRLGLSDAQLSRMRDAAGDLLPDTCTIQSVATVSDGAGGWTESWTDVATVSCRMDPVSARTRGEVAAAQEATKTFYVLTVPYNAPLAVGRRVVHGGVTYQIAEVHIDESWTVTRRARLAVVE